MPDREKVIGHLNDCMEASRRDNTWVFVRKDIVEDAITLLKREEVTTFKPHYIDKYSKHFICGVECGACCKEISSTYHYCPWCGRQIKWE
jgi:hypothetical protein